MSAYELWQAFVAKWGLVYFALIFFAVCGYTFWPARKSEFDKAARAPLDED